MKIGRNKPPFDIDDAKYDFHDFTGITEKDLLDWWLDESISEKRSPKKRKSQWPINNSIIDELPENPDIHLIFEEVVKRLSGNKTKRCSMFFMNRSTILNIRSIQILF